MSDPTTDERQAMKSRCERLRDEVLRLPLDLSGPQVADLKKITLSLCEIQMQYIDDISLMEDRIAELEETCREQWTLWRQRHG